MEPISIALLSSVVGGATGGIFRRWAELVWDEVAERWVGKDVDGDPETSRAKAFEQAQALLAQLGVELARLSARVTDHEAFLARVDRAIGDPDFIAALKASVIAGSRTGNSTKRDVLARAVAERLGADQDSLPALAAKIAVDATSKLSGEHLRVLALLAVLHVIRPPGIPISPEPPPGVERHRVSEEEAAALEAYAPWLVSAIEAVIPAHRASESDLAHLVSAGCITRERGFHLDVEKVIWPLRRSTTLAATGRLIEPLRQIKVSQRGTHLRDLWNDGLESATLTPAGVLVGTAAYDSIAATETPLDWNAAHIVSPVLGKSHAVWNGQNIDGKFVEALGKALRDLAARRVSPWYDLLGRRR